MGALYGILGDASEAEMTSMGARLSHRGETGASWSPGASIHLGVRGSARAVQRQAQGGLAFDGAIDNRRELGRLLGRPRPEELGSDDDAVLLHELVGTLGVEALAQVAGQFAAAVWLPAKSRLILVRDRIGYAPLYFARDQGRVIFASEYKALLAIAGIPATPNRDALQTIHATKWTKAGATCLTGVYPSHRGVAWSWRPGRCGARDTGTSPYA